MSLLGRGGVHGVSPSSVAGGRGGPPPRSQVTTSVSVAAATTVTPGTSLASAGFCAATTAVSKPSPAAAATAGSTPGTRSQLPVQPDLGEEHGLGRDLHGRARVSRRSDKGDGDAQVGAGAALGQAGRRQADGDLAPWPFKAAVEHGCTNPVPGLTHAPLGPPH